MLVALAVWVVTDKFGFIVCNTMLAQVMLQRAPRSVSEVTQPPVPIVPITVLAAVLLRRDRPPFFPAVGVPPNTYMFIDSVVNTSGNVSLVNDVATPSPNQFYGTDPSGVRGWQTPAHVSVIRGFQFGNKKNSGIPTGRLDYVFTCPYAGTISAWSIAIGPSDSGTITIRFWKLNGAIPTVTNRINTAGVSLTTGNYIHSTSLGDFSTLAVAVNDVFAVEVLSVGGTITTFNGSLEITT